MTKLPRDIRKKIDNKQMQINSTFKTELKHKLFQEEFMAKKTVTNSKFSFLNKVNPGPAIAVLIMIVFVGATSAAVTNTRANNAREAEIELPADLAAVLSVDDIRAVALSEVPNGVITGVELEQEDGRLLYKVKFNDGSYKLYDANTGELVNKAQLEVDESVPAGFVATISLQEARTIAQNQQPGKTIVKIELEVENGVVVYSVRFSDDSRVDVSASDGSIIRVKTGDDSGDTSGDDSNDESDDDSSDRSNDDSSNDSSDDNSGPDSSDDNSGSSNDDSSDHDSSEDDSDDDSESHGGDDSDDDNSGSNN